LAANYKSVLKDIRAKQLSPVYLFHGEEAYYTDRLISALEENVLTEAEKGFNLMTFYGRDTDARTVIDAAMRYPMFAERQLVLVKEAQQMRDFDKLLPYIEKAQPTTVLAVAYKYKKYPANRKLYKAFAKQGTVLESKKIRDDQVAKWVMDAVGETEYKIAPRAAALLQEYLGADLAKVNGELEKLYLNIEKGATIDVDAIEEHIGISKDYNVFELVTALLYKDRDRVWRIVEYFRANPKASPFVLVMGSLFNAFQKVYMSHLVSAASDRELASALRVSPWFVKDYRHAAALYPIPKLERIFGQLLAYDLRSKGVDDAGTPPGELLREMVWKILA
jgi:DNA polymerase-3 subunit delta